MTAQPIPPVQSQQGTARRLSQIRASSPDWLTAELVRGLFDYDADTGALRHRPNRRPGPAKGGCRAGSLDPTRGYRVISIKNKSFREHRIIWLYVHGELPAEEIDHENRDRSDNRVTNLRIATRGQNTANIAVSSRTGYKGVTVDLDRVGGPAWDARIKVAGKTLYLGRYYDPADAAAAYDLAAIKHQGPFAALNFPSKAESAA